VKTLSLTSPPMHGAETTRMQQALIKGGYLAPPADGVYGPLSAQGAYRAKYWLGYKAPDQTAGDVLLAILEGRRQATPVMKRMAVERKKAQLAIPVRRKALNWLIQRIGEKEHPPDSNRVKWASEWYGVIGPWCAMAVTRAYVECGSQAFKKGSKYAYVPFIVNDAVAAVNGLALTKAPQPGDLVCFDWNKDAIADHVGLFVRWTDTAQTQFQSVEGNTAVGNDSNGGEVMERNRTRAQVQVFVHVAR
jgi:hypothetical protein